MASKKMEKNILKYCEDNFGPAGGREIGGGSCEKLAGSSGINEQSLKFWLKTQITVTKAAPEYSIDSC